MHIFPKWSELFPNLYKELNLCLCFCLPPPASPGCLGRPSWVVRGQSHAGKLDWRVHRLLLWFQTQGKSQLPSCCSLFIPSSFSFSFNLSLSPKCCSLFSVLCFCPFLSQHWLLVLFWIPLFIYVFLLKIVCNYIQILTLLFAFSCK